MSPVEVLSVRSLLAAAGTTSFERGEGYVRRVRDVRIAHEQAEASIMGSSVYSVDLDWSGRRVSGRCTCPHHARGHFCKHLVALGLAVLDNEGDEDGDSGRSAPSTTRAPRDSVVLSTEELLGLVNDTLRTRGYVDHQDSFEVAADAEAVLDTLEEHLDNGAHEAARPALLRALTRLRAITQRADDSSGLIGDACQRAADLFARCCRAGHSQPVRLARWLVRFRAESPGWPETTLSDFVGAFDEAALRAYRSGVAALERKNAGADLWRRGELDLMALELADHDGDVDAAVAVLSRGEHPRYAAIVDRLRLAGRLDDVTHWVDRGVAAGRVSAELGVSRDHWLDPEEVAGEYLAQDRVDDAVGVFRGAFNRRPDVATFSALVGFAESIGLGEEQRRWALESLHARVETASGNAALLVQIALAEGDLETAWAVADELGCGHTWQPLAAASAEKYPSRAAALHRREVDGLLRFADSTRYAAIAASLSTIRELSLRAGEEREFAAYLSQIRSTYRRRPALMAALDRRRL